MPAFDEEEEDRTFVQRHKGLVIAGVLLIAGAGVLVTIKLMPHGSQPSPQQVTQVTVIPIPLPKSTPAPTPLATPPPENTPPPKMIAEKSVDLGTKTPPPTKPEAALPGPIHTSIAGPAGNPDLRLGPDGGGPGTPGGGDDENGSKYGWYASQVQQRVADALRNNPRTRKASMNIIVRIWPDSTGRIAKFTISGAEIDAALRDALQNGVLAGLRLNEPPPADMSLPIVMRLSAKRP